MEWDYAKQCEYIALFDADYQPEPDFLLRTVPFLMHNSNVALVQARWVFGKTSSSVLFSETEHLIISAWNKSRLPPQLFYESKVQPPTTNRLDEPPKLSKPDMPTPCAHESLVFIRGGIHSLVFIQGGIHVTCLVSVWSFSPSVLCSPSRRPALSRVSSPGRGCARVATRGEAARTSSSCGDVELSRAGHIRGLAYDSRRPQSLPAITELPRQHVRVPPSPFPRPIGHRSLQRPPLPRARADSATAHRLR